MIEQRDALLDYDAAAERLGISVRSLRRLTAAGAVAYVKVGSRAVRFHPADLDAFVASRTERAS